ncbi:MAG: calcium-binding protein [Sphingopyxis sp.]|uniref:calcium-binding protein n=1 Tax=Sphingopyxis sp. TaxID=1908224 RepID=UPI0032EB52D1
MLKQMLLIGAAAASIPAIAQTTPPAGDPTNPPTTTEPATPAPLPDSTSPAPAPAPVPDASVPPAASEPAPSGTAATPAQIAQIVDQEFPTYDGDGSGELSEPEFGAWMKKLRAATDPAADPESAEVQAWIGQAYVAADADKSGGVSKAELTAFLSRGN